MYATHVRTHPNTQAYSPTFLYIHMRVRTRTHTHRQTHTQGYVTSWKSVSSKCPVGALHTPTFQKFFYLLTYLFI